MKLDSLGRITIPREYLRIADIALKSKVFVTLENNEIIVKKIK